MHLTTIYSSTWTCTCASPFKPHPSLQMTAEDAERDGRAHVEYYNNRSWPHEVRVMTTTGGAA